MTMFIYNICRGIKTPREMHQEVENVEG